MIMKLDPLKDKIPLMPPPPIPQRNVSDLFGIGSPLLNNNMTPPLMNYTVSPDTNVHSEAIHKELVEAHVNQMHGDMVSRVKCKESTKSLTTEQARSSLIRDKRHAEILNKEIFDLQYSDTLKDE